MTWRMIQADCIEAMQGMDEASVDAIVTDPPYGLEFMGKGWDRLQADVGGRDDLRASLTGERVAGGEFGERIGIAYGTPHKNPRCRKCYKLKHDHDKGRCKCAAPDWDIRKAEYGYAMQWWHQAWAEAARRVLKPGGHLLAFGGTRTYHRLACGLEDAGFEIRDCLAWLYGSGFPKSLDVSKAIDKAAGAEREVVGVSGYAAERSPRAMNPGGGHRDVEDLRNLTAPATPDAERWQGWGTALKPAFEPIVLARKPLTGTVAANVLEHGVGALNIDGTRIGTEDSWEASGLRSAPSVALEGGADGTLNVSVSSPAGRWPANVLLDEQAAVGLGENARYFYQAKADREERNRGLGHRVAAHSPDEGYGSIQTPILDRATPRENWDPHKAQNTHPTVKPVELMQWLCRLITPPKGTILDPFTGSGTTGIAALREGFSFIGIEREADYVEIARDRIIGDAPLFNVQAESPSPLRSGRE